MGHGAGGSVASHHDEALPRLKPIAAALLCAGAFSSGSVAGPEGGTVVRGQAAIVQTSPSRTDVRQSTSRAIIDWRGFSIAPSEHVNFQQPGTSAATLNRVTGAQSSNLEGRLTANGQVFLINPNGILIGRDARIDVGAFVASTANISNDNFMAGRLKFDEAGNRNATIVNRGQVSLADGGLIAFVAPGIENSGVLTARLGKVVLASGNAFTLDLHGDGMVKLVIDEGVAQRITDVHGRPLASLVNQAGTVDAAGGTVLLAASAAKLAVDQVINMSGVVTAQSVAQRGGEIVLSGGASGAVHVGGTLDASGKSAGERGGTVKVLGERVTLADAARVDVSGHSGGGTALVGGDYQGKGGTPTARTTTVASGARIVADARDSGKGGKVIVWADDATRFEGTFTARGGPRGGDGGLVEVSGKRSLDYRGRVDAAAPAGKPGTLLLDPENWIVGVPEAASLVSALARGTSVMLDATNNIEINSPIEVRSVQNGRHGATFTAAAGNGVSINANVFTAEGAVLITAGAGGITMRSGTIILARNQPITFVADGSITAEHLVTTGRVALTSRAGGVTLNRDLSGPSFGRIGGLDLSAFSAGTVKGVFSNGPVNLSVSAGPLTLAGPIQTVGGVTLTGSPIVLKRDIFSDGGNVVFNSDLTIDTSAHAAGPVSTGGTNLECRDGAGACGDPFRLVDVQRFDVANNADAGQSQQLKGELYLSGTAGVWLTFYWDPASTHGRRVTVSSGSGLIEFRGNVAQGGDPPSLGPTLKTLLDVRTTNSASFRKAVAVDVINATDVTKLQFDATQLTAPEQRPGFILELAKRPDDPFPPESARLGNFGWTGGDNLGDPLTSVTINGNAVPTAGVPLARAWPSLLLPTGFTSLPVKREPSTGSTLLKALGDNDGGTPIPPGALLVALPQFDGVTVSPLSIFDSFPLMIAPGAANVPQVSFTTVNLLAEARPDAGPRAAETDAAEGEDGSESRAYGLLLFYSGRGVARSADLGRDPGGSGVPFDVFGPAHHVVLPGPGNAAGGDARYFRTDSFGRVYQDDERRRKQRSAK